MDDHISCLENEHLNADSQVSRSCRPPYAGKKANNMTEEERKKRNEHRRIIEANMTAERRAKINENRRKRRANMSEEQRMKRNEYRRKWTANRPDEKRLRKNEYERQRKAKMAQERKMKEEYLRQRKAELAERRLRKLENGRKRRENMSEEDRIKLREYKRLWAANMTKEQRQKINEYRRVKRANMIEAEWQLENGRKCPADLPEEQLLKKCKYKSLRNLIKLMVSNNMNIDIIPGLHKNIFRGILKLFGIDYSCKNILVDPKSALKRISYDIDVVYLIELLQRWEGWHIKDGIEYFTSDESYLALFVHLKINFMDFKLQRENFLQDELNKIFISESYIHVSCSLKQLQTLFHHSPQNYIKFYRDDIFLSSLSCDSMDLSPKYVIIWPYVSTRIGFPNFSMEHRNDHVDEYQLINITNGSNTVSVKNECIDIFTNETANNSESYLRDNLAKFLYQLKDAVISIVSDYMTLEKKAEIMTALIVFEKDISQSPELIHSNSKYDCTLSSYPYARYLGNPDDRDFYTSMADQKAVRNSRLNVRLQQVRHPKASFLLDYFNVSYEIRNEDLHFLFDEWFLHGVNACISYNCLLCNEFFESSRFICDHFFKHHGFEPDWECVKCLQSFTNDYLLNNDWKHVCMCV